MTNSVANTSVEIADLLMYVTGKTGYHLPEYVSDVVNYGCQSHPKHDEMVDLLNLMIDNMAEFERTALMTNNRNATGVKLIQWWESIHGDYQEFLQKSKDAIDSRVAVKKWIEANEIAEFKRYIAENV